MEQLLNTTQWVWVDYAIAVVMVFSSLIGLVRGFIKEAFALTSWGVAIMIGFKYNSDVSILLQN